MRGYALILNHPYMALSDSKGNFKLEQVPKGKHELRIWHETTGWVLKKEVVLDAAELQMEDTTLKPNLHD